MARDQLEEKHPVWQKKRSPDNSGLEYLRRGLLFLPWRGGGRKALGRDRVVDLKLVGTVG